MPSHGAQVVAGKSPAALSVITVSVARWLDQVMHSFWQPLQPVATDRHRGRESTAGGDPASAAIP
ncbi:MAG: hypothetical protein V9G16_00695 [Nitrosomonas sp.]